MQNERETIAKTLDAVNRRFYATHGMGFDQTRQAPWPAWHSIFSQETPSTWDCVVDVGCGNGRFAAFLSRFIHPQNPVRQYVGLERDQGLMAIAASHPYPFECRFRAWDWMTLEAHRAIPRASLIVAFGILHHVFGYQRRLKLVSDMAAALEPNGRLIVSTWDFGRHARYQKKYLDPSAVCSAIGINPAMLEPHDYFLSFGQSGSQPRYCHWTSNEEMRQLYLALRERHPKLNAIPFHGDANDLNRYWIFQRAE